MSNSQILETKNVSKSFSGVEVLHDVNFSVNAGEVHALIGENGAGKSTLLKILSGVYVPDKGDIVINGNVIEEFSPSKAHQYGFSIIYQELVLAQNLSVYENISLGNEPRKILFYDRKEAIKRARKYIEMVNSREISPIAKVGDLSIAQQQLVEIARALARDTRIIAMDEPTSSLTEVEIEGLFKLICSLKESGHSIIYVSHRLEEIFKIADRVTVLRDGRIIDTLPIAKCDKQNLINLMAGEEIKKADSRRKRKSILSPTSEKVLEVKGLTIPNLLEDINFTLYKGEILGLAGLVGSGRTSLLCALIGLIQEKQGEIIFNGKNIISTSTKQMISNGFGLVPEDRKLEGLCLNLNTAANLSIASLEELSEVGLINFSKENELARNTIEKINIKPPAPNFRTVSMSGGNQQKVVLGKWLGLEALKVFLLDEPTRGIDVKTKYYLHDFIKQIADSGISIIVASSELPEILDLSDRILVMKQGRISGELNGAEATKEKILQLAF